MKFSINAIPDEPTRWQYAPLSYCHPEYCRLHQKASPRLDTTEFPCVAATICVWYPPIPRPHFRTGRHNLLTFGRRFSVKRLTSILTLLVVPITTLTANAGEKEDREAI